MGIVVLGRVEDRECKVFEQLVIVGDQRQVNLDGLAHGGIVKAFRHAFAGGLVRDLFADLG
jgi:hypothetical protein